jgi:release factor glutamine methyltransferase
VGTETAVEVVERLRAAGCVAAEEEAAELGAAAGGDSQLLQTLLSRRELGEPLAWITGSIVFGGHNLRVDPGVFVPRLQSEELALRAARLLPTAGGRAADLCTGAGAIAAHLQASAPPGTFVVGVDTDLRALACAAGNGVRVVAGDLGAPLRSAVNAGTAVRFDVVTAIAPYVPTGELARLPQDVVRYEPLTALDGGPDGLDVVRRVVEDAGWLLRRGGWLLVEVGGDQDAALTPVLGAHGFGRLTTWTDEDGDLRGLAACLVEPPRRRRAWPASSPGPYH